MFRKILIAVFGIKKPPRRPRPVTVAPREVRPLTRQVPRAKYERLTGTCYVIDGDTIMIRNTRIRLWGIDAPELDHSYGHKSKWALIHLTKGRKVTAIFDGTGSHERAVALCKLEDGTDLSAALVQQGLALDWPKFSKGHYRHLEPPGVRKKLWRADARMKGRLPQTG